MIFRLTVEVIVINFVIYNTFYMMLLKSVNKSEFGERILNEIFKSPFGSIPKNELELIFLDAIISSIDPENKYNSIETYFSKLQRELKLSQTQLKNKLLAAQLRFDNKTDLDVENYIIRNIVSEKYSIDGNFIVFSILNPLLNENLKTYLESKSIILDTSFNKSILKINLNGFIKFIFHLDRLDEKLKNEIYQILVDSHQKGEIILVNKKINKSLLEKIESITTIGSNLINILDKLNPILNSLL